MPQEHSVDVYRCKGVEVSVALVMQPQGGEAASLFIIAADTTQRGRTVMTIAWICFCESRVQTGRAYYA